MNKINYEFLSLDDVSYILSLFIFDDTGILPMRDKVLVMYPELCELTIVSSDKLQITIKNLIVDKYYDFISQNNNILYNYSSITERYLNPFCTKLNNYFNIKKDYSIQVNVGLIPVFPRDIKKELYCIGKVNEKMLLDTFMHETCHFAFFKKCELIFSNIGDSDYNTPSLLWYLSEIAIDPILNSNSFQKLFDHKFKAYENFYDIKINGILLMDTIKNLFLENEIDDAIIKAYNFLLNNEKEFRELCHDNSSPQNKVLKVINE